MTLVLSLKTFYYDRKVNLAASENMHSNASQGGIPANGGVKSSEREHKLELFGFDSLVNILGLKR